MSQDEKTNYAFLSGLLQGWESALKNSEEISRVRKDMIEWSKKLAKLGGVSLK